MYYSINFQVYYYINANRPEAWDGGIAKSL